MKALLLGLLVLFCGGRSVNAQPTFTQADRKPVARGPMFVTTGRFDPSAPLGVAVSSFWVDQVTVFPLPGGGLLGDSLSLDVGRNLRNILSFDIDGDSTDDLLVVDEPGGVRDARLFSILRGAGGFHAPEEIVIQTSSVLTIRRGDFDGIGVPDVATANGGAGTVSLAYGTQTGLVAGANVFLAGSTADVAALDLDGDGLDDLAVLSERDGGTSTVTTLRSDGPGFTVLPAVTELDIVGVRMVAGHYDGDGILDLAVVADGPGVTEYGVRTLLTQRPPPGSSEPRFLVEAQTFSCPPDPRGALARCELFDAVSADFDQDGSTDLAVSMPQPGVVVVLPRLSAAFGTAIPVTVAGSPRGIAAGDVTGDGVDDLVITEFDEDMITVMRSVPGLKKQNGEACGNSGECASTYCVQATCCQQSSCSLSERCDITGHLGSCARPLPGGAACDQSTDCRSGECSSGEGGGVCAPTNPGGPCLGDCDEDGFVTVDEVLALLQIALGTASIEVCPAADGSGDGVITVDEIVGAVDIALDGC